MNKFLKKEYLPILSLVAGALALILQGLLLLLCRDEKGMLPRASILHILAWLVMIAALVVFALVVSRLQGHNRYAENFPASLTGGIGAFLAAAGIALTLPFHLKDMPSILWLMWLLLGILAVPCLIFTGLCRISGKHPSFLFHSAVCLFFAVHLVRCCQIWTSEPQLAVYGFTLFACICLMLSAYHRAAFDAGIGRRRMQLFLALAGGCLCLAAIPAAQDKLLYLGGSAWCLSNLCALNPPRRRRPHAPGEQSEESGEQPQDPASEEVE